MGGLGGNWEIWVDSWGKLGGLTGANGWWPTGRSGGQLEGLGGQPEGLGGQLGCLTGTTGRFDGGNWVLRWASGRSGGGN